MSVILLVSIGLKLGALSGALWLFSSRRDWRPGTLAAILALMTLRQALTLVADGAGSGLQLSHLDEIPELVLSLFAFVPLIWWGSRRRPRNTTARQDPEPQVHEAHRDAQRYLDIADVMLVALDADGRITLINRQGCSVLGYDSQDELVGRDWFVTCLPKRVAERTRTLFFQVLSGEVDESVVEHHENLVRTKSGAERLIKWHIDILRNQEGRKTGTLSSGQDVTDARRLESELLKFRMGIERSSDVVFLTDPDGKIIYVNPAFERLYGYSAEEALGHTPRLIKSGILPPEVYGQFWETLLSKEVVSGELVNRTKDGRLVTVDASANPVLNHDGSIIGFLAIQLDITSRKRTEQALRESEERFRAVFRGAGVGIALADVGGRILDCNESFESLLGFSRSELIGRSIADITHPDDLAEEKRLVEEMMEARQPVGNLEKRYIRKDGSTIRGHLTVSFVMDDQGEPRFAVGMVQDVTEQRLAEEALRESEERYRQIVETAQEGVWLVDGDGNTTYVNERMATMLGRVTDEMVGRPMFEFMDEEARTEAQRLLGRWRDGIAEHHELRLRHRDGGEVWTLVSSSPLFGDNGRHLGALGMIADITDRRNAESRLRLSDSILRSLNNLVIVADGQGLIRYVSPSVTRMLGYEMDELLGDGWWHRTRSDTAASLREKQLAALAASGKAPISEQPYERIVTNADGEKRWMLWHDSKGPGELLIGVGYDVTARKQAEQARRESEERYRALVEHATFGIFRSTAQGEFLAVNPALVKMLGYESADELLHADLVFDVFERPSDMDALAVALAEKGSAQGMEVRWKRKDGSSIIARLTGRPVHLASGGVECYELFAEDVTEQRALEIQLRQVQKMEAVGQLTGGIAHDFNNLLTAILSNAELVADGLQEGSELGAAVADITAAGERGAAMIKKLMAFSRRGQLDYETLEIATLCQEVVHMLQRILPEHIQISADCGEPGWTVRADRGALEQVLINLATNARDAMPRGGSLKFTVRRVTMDERFCTKQGWGRPGEYIRIEVRDTGTGMDELTRSRVFEPFFTTKPTGKGTGLGLATSYGLVKQQAGYIGVESAIGRGTAVHVYLPAQVTEPAAESDVPLDEVRGGCETVLVVEDRQDIRLTTGRMLERYGYRVLYSEDGEDALKMLKSRPGEIDLVIADLALPRLPGHELYAALGGWNDRPKFVFATGYTTPDLSDAGQLPAEVPLLQKPFSGRDLAQRVRAVLDGAH